MNAPPPARLHAELDAPLPDAVAVGAGTALFVCGWAVCDAGPVERLELLVDGDPQPLDRHGAPRLDVLRALHPDLDPFALRGVHEDPDSADDPGLHGYRSGFWGHAVLRAGTASDVRTVGLRATLPDGRTVEQELARVAVEAPPDPVALPRGADGRPPSLVVCMAVHEPTAERLGAQIASLRAQDHDDWACIVSDDRSSPTGARVLADAIRGDPRFVVSRTPRRLGFYRNFERALALVAPGVAHVALADQDDVWHPDKLTALLAGLGDGRLVYSDARVVDEAGREVSPTYWPRRRNEHEDPLSLLVANAVTGAASVLRRDLLDDALPFPPAQFAHFHDHWLGLVAASLGGARDPAAPGVRYVDRPLYDYVQHGDAWLGHAAANVMPTLRARVGALRRSPRERIGLWRMHWFVDHARLVQLATIVRLRLGGRTAPRAARALDGYLRADRSPREAGRLVARGARELVGRPATLGAEWMLAHALLWRRLLTATTRERPVRGLRLDAVPPPDLSPRPGRGGPVAPVVREVVDKIAPLRLHADDDAPVRINVLVPHVDLDHFFGGYIAKFNLALRLAGRGLRVRVVTIDPQPPLPSDWRRRLAGYAGLGDVDRLEVAFGREGTLRCSPQDRFVATTWWSAHVAHAAARELVPEDPAPFVYLIQEHEPVTFPNGTWSALASASYDLPHRALFSSELLRTWFRARGVGVFAAGEAAGDAASASFQNAITDVPGPTAAELAARGTRRLLVYARPEAHAARNLFELGVVALSRALGEGAFAGWALHGIGTTAPGGLVELGGGARLRLLPRTTQDGYARTLRDHDVGLALMHTPHPSLVPIEMAAAGMVVVTSRYETKTPEAMASISTNLVAAPPTIDGVAAALVAAAAAAEDVTARAAGARVDWARDWASALPDELVDRVVGWLG